MKKNISCLQYISRAFTLVGLLSVPYFINTQTAVNGNTDGQRLAKEKAKINNQIAKHQLSKKEAIKLLNQLDKMSTKEIHHFDWNFQKRAVTLLKKQMLSLINANQLKAQSGNNFDDRVASLIEMNFWAPIEGKIFKIGFKSWTQQLLATIKNEQARKVALKLAHESIISKIKFELEQREGALIIKFLELYFKNLGNIIEAPKTYKEITETASPA